VRGKSLRPFDLPFGGLVLCYDRFVMRLSSAVVALWLLAPHPECGAAGIERGEDRIGLAAPPFELKHWLHSPPLEIQSLKGKVVLIRWWTDGCPFCAATAPALRQLDSKYGKQGLIVIGIFHPKPPGDWSMARARAASERLGFAFPVGLDADWTALRRWWPDTEKRGWTSVSFVIDKNGIIRFVHPGGEFHEAGADGRSGHSQCRRDYKEIDEVIARLLSE